MIKRGISLILATFLISASFYSPIQSCANEYVTEVEESVDDTEASLEDSSANTDEENDIAKEENSNDESIQSDDENSGETAVSSDDLEEAVKKEDDASVENDSEREETDESVLHGDEEGLEKVDKELVKIGDENVVDSGTCGDNLTWALTGEDKNLILHISGTGDMYDFTDGSNYSGRAPWFTYSQNGKVIGLQIDAGITHIGNNAFNNIKASEITIPDTVTSIGSKVLSGSYVKKLTIPHSVTLLDDDAFYYCVDLEEIYIPKETVYIGVRAISYCNDLKKISVENGNPNYDSRNNCNALIESGTNTLVAGCVNTVIPDGVTRIGERAFSSCRATSMNIPSSVKEIGPYAFSSSKIASITLPEGVEVLAEDTFSNCTSLQTVTLPSTLAEIGDSAFYNCNELEEIEIPESVIRIGELAFDTCVSLKKVVMPKRLDYLGRCAFMHTSIAELVIPPGITQIKDNTFSGCDDLIRISIPYGVTEIQSDAFNQCYKLKSVELPSSLTEIGRRAFKDCISLNSIAIPGVIEEIPEDCFKNCRGMQTIIIEQGVMKIGNWAFSGCESVEELSIPKSVQSIGRGAFSICKSLKTLTIPRGVTSLYESFNSCSSLETINFPKSLVSISGAFKGCTNLKDIYYEGNETDFSNINLGGPDNQPVIDATKHYNSYIHEGYEEYSITVTTEGNGHVKFGGDGIENPEGVITVLEGSAVLVNFYPDSGYNVMDVTLDGKHVDNQIYIGLFDIKENHSVHITFGRMTAAEMFADYPSALRMTNNEDSMYAELYYAIATAMQEYTNDRWAMYWSSLKYNAKNAGAGNLKVIFDDMLKAGWMEDDLRRELARELVKDIADQDDCVFALFNENKKQISQAGKFYELLAKGVDASREQEFFELATSRYTADELKNASLQIAKTNEFKKLNKIYEAEGVVLNAADYLAVVLETLMLNGEVLDTLIEYVNPDTDLGKGLVLLREEFYGDVLVNQTVRIMQKEIIEKKLLGKIVEVGAKSVGEWAVKELYGLGEYKSSGTALGVGKLLFYFGSYLIHEPSADDVLKAIIAVDNANMLNYALNHERLAVANIYSSGGTPEEINKQIAKDKILYFARLIALDTAYERVSAVLPDDKAFDIRDKWNLIRPSLSYEKNMAACIANAKTMWITEHRQNSGLYSASLMGAGSDLTIYGMQLEDQGEELHLEIPAEINGSSVRHIGDGAFASNDNIVLAYIPDSVETVGDSAFENCGNLRRIYLQEGLETIGTRAFAGCTSLTEISIPASVTAISEDAFSGIQSIKLITTEGSFAETFVKEHYTGKSEIRERNIESISISSESDKKKFELTEAVDLSGMVLGVSYSDGTSTTVDKGFYAIVGERKLGNTIIAVFYKGCSIPYEIEFLPCRCTYTVRYRSDQNEILADDYFGEGYTGEEITLPCPEVLGYSVESTTLKVTLGAYNSFTVIYRKGEKEETEKQYTSTPVSDPASGSTIGAQHVISLLCGTSGAEIYYTVDGTDPTTNSTVYNAPIRCRDITASGRLTIKCYAKAEGYEPSRVCTFVFYVKGDGKDYGDILDEDIPAGDIPTGIWCAGVESAEFTGKAVKPDVRVYDGNVRLNNRTDYTLVYKNNTKACSIENLDILTEREKSKLPQVQIKFKGNYTGTQIEYFSISPINIGTNDAVDVSNLVVAYNKKKQTPSPILSWDGKKLKLGTDFTVREYDNKKSDKTAFAGDAIGNRTYMLTLEGKGNYTGTKAITLTIVGTKTSAEVPQVLMSKAKTTVVPAQNYTGSAYALGSLKDNKGKNLVFEVSYNQKKLVKDEDYSVKLVNSKDPGVATMIIGGLCNEASETGISFIGEKRITFSITGTSIAKAKVTGLEKSYEYTGDQITEPKAALLGIDPSQYDVTYSANTNVGTVNVFFTGKNGYVGTRKASFKIKGYPMTGTKISLSSSEELKSKYVKGGSKPTVRVSFGGKELLEGKDYTVSYKNNSAVKDATQNNPPIAVITGKGNFSGKVTVPFTIEQKSSADGLSMLAYDKVWSNKKGNYKTTILVTDTNGLALKAVTDYDSAVNYYMNGELLDKNYVADEGDVITAEIRGKGNYSSETLCASFRMISPTKDISKAVIKIADQPYTGKEIKICDTAQFAVDKKGKIQTYMKHGNEVQELRFLTDFEIVEGSYFSNVKKGRASALVRGKNEYGGIKKVTFNIVARNSLLNWFKD